MKIKSLSLCTFFTFLILFSFSKFSHAEYYVVYSAPGVMMGCDSCQSRKYVKHRYVKKAPAHKQKRHYVHHRPHSTVKMEVYYGWYVNPSPTCCNYGWVSSKCGSPCGNRPQPYANHSRNYYQQDRFAGRYVTTEGDEGTPFDMITGDDVY